MIFKYEMLKNLRNDKLIVIVKRRMEACEH